MFPQVSVPDLMALVLVVLPLVLVFLKASVLLKVPLLLPAYSLS